MLADGPGHPFANPLHIGLALGDLGAGLLHRELDSALDARREALQHVLVDPVVQDFVLPDRLAGAVVVFQLAPDIDLRIGQRHRDLDRFDGNAELAAVADPAVLGLLGDGEGADIETGRVRAGLLEQAGQLAIGAFLSR